MGRTLAIAAALAATIVFPLAIGGCGDGDKDPLPEDTDLGVDLAQIVSVTGASGTINIVYNAVGDGPLMTFLRYSVDAGATFQMMTAQPLPLLSRNPENVGRETYNYPFDWDSVADIPGSASVLIQLEVLDMEGVGFDLFGPISVDNAAAVPSRVIEEGMGISPTGIIEPRLKTGVPAGR